MVVTGPPRVNFAGEDVEDLTYSDASIDAVLSCVMIRVLARGRSSP